MYENLIDLLLSDIMLAFSENPKEKLKSMIKSAECQKYYNNLMKPVHKILSQENHVTAGKKLCRVP